MISKRTKPRLSWSPRFSNMRFLQDPMATWVPSYEFFIGKAMLVHWTHLPHLSQLKMMAKTSMVDVESLVVDAFRPGWSGGHGSHLWGVVANWIVIWCGVGCYSKNGWPDGRSLFNKLVESQDWRQSDLWWFLTLLNIAFRTLAWSVTVDLRDARPSGTIQMKPRVISVVSPIWKHLA